MTEPRRFNVNESVKVKLTEFGLSAMKADYEALMGPLAETYPFKERPTDAEGYTDFQLWDLMQTLGPHVRMGGPVPFETEIIIP